MNDLLKHAGVRKPKSYTDNSGTGLIRVYTGKLVRPLDLKPSDVDILDIAHSLARQCRFAGHVDTFYSIAQHSILVSHHAGESSGDPMIALWGLLHDAAEAYLTDFPQPIKHFPGFARQYIAAEKRAMASVVKRFKLRPEKEPDIIRYWDKVLVCTELRDFLHSPGAQQYDVPLLDSRLEAWDIDAAEAEFHREFQRLTGILSF